MGKGLGGGWCRGLVPLVPFSEHVDHFSLGVAAPLDVGHRHVQIAVTGELLHVPQGTTSLHYLPCGVGDEGSATGMGGTTFQSHRRENSRKPIDDTRRRHASATLAVDHQISGTRLGTASRLERDQGLSEGLVERDLPSTPTLAGSVLKGDLIADASIGARDHRPSERRDLLGPQSGLKREQSDDPIPLDDSGCW